MSRARITAIKQWIKTMGFELIKSHVVKGKSQINYYNLGNFGIYEEVVKEKQPGRKAAGIVRKFKSWTPWGEDFEVTSVNDLSEAYQNNLSYNPQLG